MAAVRACDHVARSQRRDRPDGAALLTDARMQRAVYQTEFFHLEHGFFKGADHVQVIVHAQQLGLADVVPVLRCRSDFNPGRLVFEFGDGWHGLALVD